MAVDDLTSAGLQWPNLVEKLITHVHSYTDFAKALGHHPPDEIKAVIEWASV
jgi:hypothetical protein